MNNSENIKIDENIKNDENLEKKVISNKIIKNDDRIIQNVSIYNKYKNMIKIAFIIVIIILFIYFLYKMNILKFSFTSINLYNNKIQSTQKNREFEELTNNDSNWNIEDAIEKIIKNQNIYIQEKKL